MTFQGKRVLITGGTGSLGQALTRRLLSGAHGAPRKIIILSRDEAKQQDMRMAFLHRRVTTDEVIYHNFERVLEFRIGDVRRYADVSSALRDADIVVNAAALKQVPTCEYFPEQAVHTNILGPQNIVRAIGEHRLPVEVVVGLSTDKACAPVNVMGMTKAMQERLLVAANLFVSPTRFVCVRYGNILASRGSVIPLFHEQIKRGGPVTVTVPEMTRFLLSLDEAVDTIVAAAEGARRGEMYVTRAPSARLIDLAQALIGDRPIDVSLIGPRPGERMHEVVLSEEECLRARQRGNFYVLAPMLPELQEAALPGDGERPPAALSSADVTLDLDETRALLARHRLLVDDVADAQGLEMAR